MTEELHKLGEVLRTARESRGVDLARVERDTKIRSRYLSALERGEYRELPGAVYTRGFLRNYGLYLGLDPEYLVDLYRLETNGVADRGAPAPPRPITIRRARAFVVTPGAIAAAVLTIAVIAFIGYLAYEFITFARTPDLRLTQPAGDVAGYHQTSYTIVGVTEPNSRVTVDGLRENPVVNADAQGRFSVTVQLVPGSNVITLVANDPVTQRDSHTVTLTISVDLGGPTPTPSSGLALGQPADGATITGAVRVAGTTVAGGRVAIVARLVNPGAPGFTVKDRLGQVVKIPAQRAGQQVSAAATAGSDGAFTASLALAPGAWEVSVGAGPPATAQASATAGASPAGSTLPAGTVTRRITVNALPGLHGTLKVSGSPSYLAVLQDSVDLAGVSGRTAPPGKSYAVSANRTLVVLAGNAGAVRLTINGILLDPMGSSGQVIQWQITTS